jgi:uncharacterized RDD family membrane protein YckC
MDDTPALPAARTSLLPRRLAALFYDLWVCVAMWLLISAAFTAAWTLAGHGLRQNIAPFSAWQWALWACCWLAAGLYAVASWRRGGQTLGMRPWRVAVVDADGGSASSAALWRRYATGSVSLLCGGLGFWWALVDRERLTLHDRLSGTRLVRVPVAG